MPSSSNVFSLSDESSDSSLSRKLQQSVDSLPIKKRQYPADEGNCATLEISSSHEADLRLLATLVNLRPKLNDSSGPSSKKTKTSRKSSRAQVNQDAFFSYTDRSNEQDDDPLTPLTPFGSIPNFPAKVYAILANPMFKDVAEWMPHGRSWRVTNQKQFEKAVLPVFFDHANFSSFVRQANGWGFRRINKGKDKHSYYHEYFLRGLPHLCKKMTRPGRSEKAPMNPKAEPDFYRMSERYPLPENPITDVRVLLLSTVEGGPKAKVPVSFGVVPPKGSVSEITRPLSDEPVPITRELLDALAPIDPGTSSYPSPDFNHGMSSSALRQSFVSAYQLNALSQNLIPHQQPQEYRMNSISHFAEPQQPVASPYELPPLASFVSFGSA